MFNIAAEFRMLPPVLACIAGVSGEGMGGGGGGVENARKKRKNEFLLSPPPPFLLPALLPSLPRPPFYTCYVGYFCTSDAKEYIVLIRLLCVVLRRRLQF